MKNLFATVILLTGIIACNENKQPKASPELVNNPATADSSNLKQTNGTEQGAVITFEKNMHDFGTITQGEQAEYNFKFTNTGDQDLIISAANASCGCTVPEYPKEPIKPGSGGYIKVKFNSDYRLDAFEKSVSVTANTNPLTTVLIIRGFINPKPGTEASKTSPIH